MYRKVEALMRKGAWEDARRECAALCERFEEAAVELERAVTLEPDHYEAALKLAQSLDRLGRYEDAYDVVREFLPRRPDDPTLLLMAQGLEEFVPRRITDGWEKSVRLDHRIVELAGREEVILPDEPEPDQYGPRRR